MPTTTRYAPAPGADAEFDEMWSRVWSTVTSSGNPEKLKEDDARELFAERLATEGGRTFVGVPKGAPAQPEPEPEPTELQPLIVPKMPEAPYWYENPADARLFDHHILARRRLGLARHGGLMISGGAGYGKTMGVLHGVRRINQEHELNLRLTVMNCATVTDPQKWFGRREADKTGTHYFKSDFVEAVERGDVILLDDLARIHGTIANSLFGFLDGLQSVHLSDLGVEINVHPETVFIATMNQGSQYGAQHRLDWAWRERFPYTIEKNAPPRPEEIRILTSTTGCDADAAAVLVDGAGKSRGMFERGELRNPISTRSLVSAAWLVAAGATEIEALRYTVFPLYDPDSNGVVGAESDRTKVEAIFDLRRGR